VTQVSQQQCGRWHPSETRAGRGRSASVAESKIHFVNPPPPEQLVGYSEPTLVLPYCSQSRREVLGTILGRGDAIDSYIVVFLVRNLHTAIASEVRGDTRVPR